MDLIKELNKERLEAEVTPVKVGDTVEKNQTLLTIEAMKMETNVVARMAGTVEQVLIKEGGSVKAGELLITIK